MARKQSTGKKARSSVVQRPAARLPSNYPQLFDDIKSRIRSAQVKAALSVNRELIALYWDIGEAIVQRQQTDGWGRAVIEHLAADLLGEFPGVSGFSASNLWRMRAFHLAYSRQPDNLAQPVREIRAPNLAHPVRERAGQDLPQPVAQIPWGHNVVLIEKLKDTTQRLWYAQQTLINGWSRAVLVHQIESDAFARQGKALTNFQTTLPAPQSDLAQNLLKDPYTFDFLALGPDITERQLERSLISHLKDFLIELGTGFAFVGEQHHLEVAGQDYYLDLLFYHLHLGCYVVIDLKIEKFKPEFAGRMSFYLSAVDEQLPNLAGRPAIGLILCKERNRLIVEYTLRDMSRPMGVATYKTLPAKLKGELPTAKQIRGAMEDKAGFGDNVTVEVNRAKGDEQ